ncbi:class I SAM-dependent methyltransferase [Halobacillus shinanisalinarum]|uniref:Class I SAM-dependent methyltransferase n=1 Tax=Halobacillus shinanisalinarum TaxID=2932258 RepID=A0ABY4GV38_9BACI|nr:class I SAM-dependent methyltransferase [Halobacillus shinanisalinarum]UOQ91770.1 class I SAM-dependent methyltransferase [Halobacillus shinanisalinarum]
MLDQQFSKPRGWIGKGVGLFMAKENEELNRWTQSFLSIDEQESVLEIGFGPGTALAGIAKKHPTVNLYGIDASEAMLTMALKRLNKVRGLQQICLIHGEASMIQNVQKRFDKVYSINNITYWNNPVYTLRHIRSQMNTSGKIALTLCPHEDGATDSTTEVLGGQLKSILHGAGFSQIEIFIKPTKPNNTVCAVAIN